MNRRSAAIAATLAPLFWLAGCAQPAGQAPPPLDDLLPTPLLLLGEQHDAPEHQQLQRATVRLLAQRGELAALVIEMAEQGRQTTGLPADAAESLVRERLDWVTRSPGGWSWSSYGPVVMAAVRAGVPVLGGNLPRARMRAAMADESLDQRLSADTLRQQRDNIRQGHCHVLPESQVAPMTRIQIARDQTMASTALAAIQPGQTVLLVAGNQHVRRDLGVPLHLPPGQPLQVLVMLSQADGPADPTAAAADRVWNTPPRPPRDHCAELKTQFGR